MNLEEIAKKEIESLDWNGLRNYCKDNGIKVIAEYVENQKIVELLKDFGVDYGQGYFFSKPLPYDAFYPNQSSSIR